MERDWERIRAAVQKLDVVWQQQQLLEAGDIIDVDERTEQRIRDMCWNGKTEKPVLNPEQGTGDYIAG